ncbi:SAV_2336 N-terminal domain-related protein [Streptomyces sp. NPDC048338]|uniref:SAV_2336 N-terminal domain-related protein n=1 Tax=Streptomyces sp. NPDC048338 TaxID=3365536 RepID=UPI00371AFC24
MTSDRPEAGTARTRRTLDALASVLAQAAGEPPTGRELAELLWLARQMRPPLAPAVLPDPAGRAAPPPVPARPVPQPDAVAPEVRPVPPDPTAPSSPPGTTGGRSRVPLRRPAAPRPPAPAEAPGEAARHAPLLAPAPPMLAHPLALQRSLRPLGRGVPSGTRLELDETATAHRIAALGAGRRLWLPVLRPQQERWLHLRIVFDAGPTMTMWRPLVRDLHTALAQTGAFRTLDLLRLGTDGRLPQRHRERGRTALLVVSDCMGPQWRAGAAGRRWRSLLAGLGRELPVAVVQPLPERLWRHSAAPALPGLFASPGPGVPNAALDFAPYRGGPAPSGVPVPVLEPTGAWLGNWAALVSASGGTEVPGAAAYIRAGESPDAWQQEEGFAPDEADPRELVLRFRALASPQAFRLAAHLAVGSAHLPVMRLVQAAVEVHPEPGHLAEVVLSGMLRAQPEVGPGAYEFRPGVREVLLGTLPRTALVGTAALLARMSAEIESRAGALPGEFRALVESLDGRTGERAAGRAFALVSEESVRLLRGPERGLATRRSEAEREPEASEGGEAPPDLGGDRYELRQRVGDPSSRTWLAYDHVLGRRVGITYHPFPPRHQRGWAGADSGGAAADFIARAHELATVTHHNLLHVVDALVLEDGCCLVTEPLEGLTLRQYLDESSGAIEVDEAVTIAQGVLCGLEVLHNGRHGIVHGNLTPAVIFGADDGLPRLHGYGSRWPYADGHGDPDGTGLFPADGTAGTTPRPGTARYLAPERRRGPAVPESDLYSLGCILFEMLTGAPPFPGGDLDSVLRRHADAPPPSPQGARMDVPPELSQAVRDLLAKDPSRRHQGAAALSELRSPRTERNSQVVYRVLGPPMASIRGIEVSEHSFEHNALLCRLLLARGLPVSEAELRETLRENPDVRPSQYALHLSALGHPIRSRGEDYWLHTSDVYLDLTQAETLAAQGHDALEQGDRRYARHCFREALDLWYGNPLDGIAGEWAAGQRGRLLGLRADLIERILSLDRLEAEWTGWLVIGSPFVHRIDRETEAVVVDLAQEVLEGERVRRQRRRFTVLHPVPPRISGESLVDWAVNRLPLALASRLPTGVRTPLLLSVTVHDEGEAAATTLAETIREQRTEDADSLVVVTVLVSHGLRAGLPRPMQRKFDRMTPTAGGWRHVVVVRRDGAGGTRPVGKESRPDGVADPKLAAPPEQRGWFSALADRVTRRDRDPAPSDAEAEGPAGRPGIARHRGGQNPFGGPSHGGVRDPGADSGDGPAPSPYEAP